MRLRAVACSEGTYIGLRHAVPSLGRTPRRRRPARTHGRAAIAAWESTNVTFARDDIHTMTPGQGVGANTALRDTALLSHHLAAAGGRSASLSGGHGPALGLRWSRTDTRASQAVSGGLRGPPSGSTPRRRERPVLRGYLHTASPVSMTRRLHHDPIVGMATVSGIGTSSRTT